MNKRLTLMKFSSLQRTSYLHYHLYDTMSFGGVELIEATELYNLLNLGLHYPCLSDPNFLLLLGKLVYNRADILYIISFSVSTILDWL